MSDYAFDDGPTHPDPDIHAPETGAVFIHGRRLTTVMSPRSMIPFLRKLRELSGRDELVALVEDEVVGPAGEQVWAIGTCLGAGPVEDVTLRHKIARGSDHPPEFWSALTDWLAQASDIEYWPDESSDRDQLIMLLVAPESQQSLMRVRPRSLSSAQVEPRALTWELSEDVFVAFRYL
jgi:hypothetical protein